MIRHCILDRQSEPQAGTLSLSLRAGVWVLPANLDGQTKGFGVMHMKQGKGKHITV